jgi:hypothetical protein
MKVRLKDGCYMKKETSALWGKSADRYGGFAVSFRE